jgi:formaldehyde-activating enzyme
MNKVRKGKIEEAAKLQRSAQTLARIVLKHGAAPPIKAGLKMMGIKAGKCRMPLDTGGTLTPETKEEIRLELEKLGVIHELRHPHIQEKIHILEVLEEQGFAPVDSSSIKESSASSNMVSVGIAAGSKKGPLGSTFVKLLTMSKIGHEALTVILEPNLAVRPITLMFPVRKIESMRQASLFYGPVQSGAARAVTTYLENGKIPLDSLQNDVMILAMDVDLNSRNRREVTTAAQEAVERALAGIWR